ncbi:SMI1/KNR4 family protein [Rhizobium leguminosarum]
MQLPSHQGIWSWYKQFSHETDDKDPRMSNNYFCRASPLQIAEFKNEFGSILPEVYETFLLEIGSGYLKEDKNSKISTSYYNEFLSLREIAAIVRKETTDWEIYPDFIDEGEVPFFSEMSNSVFVFDQGNEGIHFPYLKERKFADTLDEFLGKLMVDCEFYINI